MKKLITIGLVLLTFQSGILAQTNDFYDDAPQSDLKMSTLTIGGEVENPGVVDFSSLPVRQVVVKETEYNNENGKFTGAYQYEGYSLYDMLDKIVLKKKNQEEFPPIIDLYVEVESASGEKVVLSWGEIYYPIHRHEILIAAKVRRIVPSKTKDLWPLPVDAKLVVASDLHTERNISNPVKITVKSGTVKYRIDRDIKDMYANDVKFYHKNTLVNTLTEKTLPGLPLVNYGSVFYGRGRGIHGTTPFRGMMLKDFSLEIYPMDMETLRNGLFVVAAPDGYRAVFSYSEIFNRNDQAEVLIVPMVGISDQGAYILYPAADFFSDRSIRCLNEIRFLQGTDM